MTDAGGTCTNERVLRDDPLTTSAESRGFRTRAEPKYPFVGTPTRAAPWLAEVEREVLMS